MCYILYMNKDVIYIEPEDDITDIITKIENSKQKIVALVPPKKAGVLRSVVNIKLISKAATGAKKTAVLVTTDPSITKLAAAAKLPITKDLQSAPTIPEVESEGEKTVKEDVTEGGDEEEEKGEEAEEEEKKDEEEDTEEEEEKDEEDEKEKKEAAPKKEKSKKGSKNKFLQFFKDHKKLSIFGGVFGLILILVLIWALAIAPAVEVFVTIKTNTNNFSESVSFVKEQTKEDIKEGKVYLEERKIEEVEEVKFEATGQKNTGERATGKVMIYAYFPLNIRATTQVAKGELFTISGLSYRATEDVILSYSGEGRKDCANKDNPLGLVEYGCRINGSVSVEAVEPGSKYNIAASSTGWDTNARVFAYSENSMGGGTDNMIKVVQQSDVEKAKTELSSKKESENKEKLYETINTDDNLIIESTFDQTTSAAVSTPAVDEEVKDGVQPTLKTTTVTSVYTIDRTKLEELIKEKVDLPENEKIFKIENVYIDGFKEVDSGFVGKLKAVYYTGPKVTESELVEKIMGKGIGDARREINDIEGVKVDDIKTSYPWVMKVPTNSNRITINLDIEGQNGEKIEDEDEKKDEKDEKNAEKTDDSKAETE